MSETHAYVILSSGRPDDGTRKVSSRTRGLSDLAERQPRSLRTPLLGVRSVALEAIPAERRKRLPKYPVPVAHLGRLAVDAAAQGEGLGSLLLIDDPLHLYLPIKAVVKLDLD